MTWYKCGDPEDLATKGEEYLTAIDGCGSRDDPKGPLFRTIPNRGGQLRARPWRSLTPIVGRRAGAAGIGAKVRNHLFGATGITAYLKNSGTLEKAAAMANDASTRTTQLYDRRHEERSLDEVNGSGFRYRRRLLRTGRNSVPLSSRRLGLPDRRLGGLSETSQRGVDG
jgi:hypothetical protein